MRDNKRKKKDGKSKPTADDTTEESVTRQKEEEQVEDDDNEEEEEKTSKSIKKSKIKEPTTTTTEAEATTTVVKDLKQQKITFTMSPARPRRAASSGILGAILATTSPDTTDVSGVLGDINNNNNNTTTPTTSSKASSPPPSSSSSKPIHPFFQTTTKKNEVAEKKKENQKVLEDKLKTTGVIPNMFMTKEEKDQVHTERIQEQFRKDVIKSSVDHQTVNAGKPIHPFFAAVKKQAPATTSLDDKKSIDVDQSCDSLYAGKVFDLPDFPIDYALSHVGWTNNNQPSQSIFMFDNQLKTSINVGSSVLEDDSLVPGFTETYNRVFSSSTNNSQLSQDNNHLNNNINNSQHSTTTTTTTACQLKEEMEIKIIIETLKGLIDTQFKSPIRNKDKVTVAWILNSFELFKSSLTPIPNPKNVSMAERYYSNRLMGILELIENEECLNRTGIESFNQWVSSWSDKDNQRSATTTTTTKKKKKKGDENLQPGIIIFGPYGCGKSSMVYSIGAQYDYKIIEANPSTKRNGKYIMEMFGEATQSKSLGLYSNLNTNSPPTILANTVTTKTSTRKKSSSSLPSPPAQPCGSNGASIILFEEVDILYEEDKGFLTSLSNLITASKIPIVLTCNELTPSISRLILSNELDIIYLSKPNKLFVILLLYFIMIQEKVVQYYLTPYHFTNLLSMVERYDCDIRACINHLDFFLITSSSKLQTSDINLFHLHQLIDQHDGFYNLISKQNLITNHLPDENNNEPTTKQQFNFNIIDDQTRLQSSLLDMDINIYYNNYLNILSNRQDQQEQSDQETNGLENLWKISDDMSLSDTLSFKNYPQTCFLPFDQHSNGEFDSELFEVDENSPTCIQSPETTHTNRRSNSQWATVIDTLTLSIQSFIPVVSLTLHTNSTSDTVAVAVNNSNCKQQQQGVVDLVESDDIKPWERSLFQEYIDSIIVEKCNLISYKEMIRDYLPFISAICISENHRKANNPKRGNRFSHYLDLDDVFSKIILMHSIK
ncbi:hypothetical protein DFA_05409 [Cavenderia fasciculata]|uniref:AAA+ ATPase domain-containing protein n=1 Tax=Cavenderia fasciculata TaxID=261658 RepID=F4PL55_CACFS|nr:uncharacterized protein DFA_05409 [Cavenderia fasciculata]EGG23277.1 hypothetical protein DFA_05409 [Cavenderia fasciculata]|eukprot:XP_004361128.1 hypothetical protein DFA_05409 [Cavenderia fasciculata]